MALYASERPAVRSAAARPPRTGLVVGAVLVAAELVWLVTLVYAVVLLAD